MCIRDSLHARRRAGARAGAGRKLRHPNVADGGLFPRDGPVSYTHLDVYKRQGCKVEILRAAFGVKAAVHSQRL